MRDYINHNVFAQSNQGYFREVLLDNVDDAINKLSKSTPLLKSFIEKLKAHSLLGSQTLDRHQDWIDWKNEYTNKFKELSNVAKLTSSHLYLEGVLTMGDDLLMKKNANWRRVFPPVSKTKGEASTLDHRFVQEFFTEYNDIDLVPIARLAQMRLSLQPAL